MLFNVHIKWQMNFQNPALSSMEKIIDLHNDIMLFSVFIICFILWMLLRTVYLFRSVNAKTLRFSFVHHTLLEQVWTIIPAVILLLIAGPSFALLYSMDELREPKLTVFAMGNQWFWTYEYPDYTNNTNGLRGETVMYNSFMLTEDILPKSGIKLWEIDSSIIFPTKQAIKDPSPFEGLIYFFAPLEIPGPDISNKQNSFQTILEDPKTRILIGVGVVVLFTATGCYFYYNPAIVAQIVAFLGSLRKGFGGDGSGQLELPIGA